MKLFNMIFLISLLIIVSACSDYEDPQYKERIIMPGDFRNEVWEPGKYPGRNVYLIEDAEKMVSERVNIFCQDNLNLKVNIKLRVRLAPTLEPEILKHLIEEKGWQSTQTTDGSQMRLPFDVIYNTYGKPKVREVSRTIISQRPTTQVENQREEITKELFETLSQVLVGTPLVLIDVSVSNIYYPKATGTKKDLEINRGALERLWYIILTGGK